METVPNPKTLHDKTQVKEKQPGLQHKMKSKPVSKKIPQEGSKGKHGYSVLEEYKAAGKLEDNFAVITGGDSGIGRAVACLYAKEGADVAILYLPKEKEDAECTKKLVEKEGKKCLLIECDVGYEDNCKKAISQIMKDFPRIDILVNNAGEQHLCQNIEDVSSDQLERTFRTNVFGYFYMTKSCLPHMKEGSKIINTSSVVAYRGSQSLLDYSATKGAEVSFTRSLALNLAPKGIRVNSVAPGPIQTPLQNVSRDQENLENFLNQESPLGRIGQPSECATAYVYLGSNDSSFVTGQVIHVNGGEVVNG